MKHHNNATPISETRRPTGRRPVKPVAATARSQADCASAKEHEPDVRSSEAHDRDLTVAATRNKGRTRIGKIARLPNEVREELNRRLQDGEPGDSILDWLNGLPKVRKVLAAQFGGRPINKQNLSEWKLGGYRDWERAEEDRARMDRLTDTVRLATSEDESPLSERLAAVLLVELARAMDDLQDESLPPAERWQRLRQMLREVAAMRREDHRAARLDLERDRWWLEREKLERENRRADDREFLTKSLMADLLPKHKEPKKKASKRVKLQREQEPATPAGHEAVDLEPVKPGQGKSGSADGGNDSNGSDGSVE